MTRQELVKNIQEKQTFLCVGLDPDLEKMPRFLLDYEDPIFEFNKRIIDATKDHCVAYKPNTAFYEAYGIKGWQSLEKTINYIPKNIFSIADAKRGDIGNTASRYAAAFFDELGFDAITVAPYMGEDSVKPFLQTNGKWAIVLGLTSNAGSADFQMLQTENHFLFEQVLQKVRSWGSPENLMFVIGATQTNYIEKVRKIIPDNFLLIPGIGAQGGDLHETCKYALNNEVGVLVNSSRNILYASAEVNFSEASTQKALYWSSEMKKILAARFS